MPDDRAVSLGTQGGFVRIQLTLARPLIPDDFIEVYEVAERDEDPDQYQVYLCREGSEGLNGCRILGIGRTGRTAFLVPSID